MKNIFPMLLPDLILLFVYIALGLLLFETVLLAPPYTDSFLLIDSDFRSLFEPFFAGHYYRPVVNLAVILIKIFTDKIIAFNLLSVFFHSVNAVLLSRFAYSICGVSKLGSILCSFLFFVHFAACPSVVWIAGNSDLIALCFLLLAFILTKYANTFPGVLFALICFLLAILSKETAYFGILMIGYLAYQNSSFLKKRWILFIACILLIFITLGFRWLILGPELLVKATLDSSESFDLLLLFKRMLFYHYHFFVWDLNVLNPINFVNPKTYWFGLFPAIVFFSGLIFKPTRIPALFYVLFLTPAIFADINIRYFYIPLAGAAVLCIIPFDHFLKRNIRNAVKISVILFVSLYCVILGYQTYQTAGQKADKRLEFSIMAQKIALGRNDWSSGYQVFDFCSGKSVEINEKHMVLKRNADALKYFTKNKNIKWLYSLSDYSDKHPLYVFYLKDDDVLELENAQDSIDRYLDKTNFDGIVPHKIRMNPQDDGSYLCHINYEWLNRYKYLILRGISSSETNKQLVSINIINASYHSRQLFSLKAPIKNNEFSFTIYTPDIGWNFRSDKLKLLLNMGSQTENLSVTLTNSPANQTFKPGQPSKVLKP